MKTLKLCSLLAVALLTPVLGAGNWHTDFEAARKLAAKEKKDLLIDFTGSDWCGWCIKLRKEVFDHEAFKKGVADRFVLVELDYPRDKSKQSEETRAQNTKLLKQFGVRGFPTVILCDAKGEAYARTGYQQGGPEHYVKHLVGLQAKRNDRPEAQKVAKAVAKPTAEKKAAEKVAARKPERRKVVGGKKKPADVKKPECAEKVAKQECKEQTARKQTATKKQTARPVRKPLARKEAPKPKQAAKKEPAKPKGRELAKQSDEQLKKALEEGQRDLARIMAVLEKTDRDWEAAQKVLETMRKQVREKEQELAKLRNAIAENEKKAGVSEKKHEAAHVTEAKLKGSLESIEKELARRDLITKLERQAAELQRKAEQLRKQAEKLRAGN